MQVLLTQKLTFLTLKAMVLKFRAHPDPWRSFHTSSNVVSCLCVMSHVLQGRVGSLLLDELLRRR